MEQQADTNCLEDREEGEIVEDEFEDVSDCSMSISPIDSPLPHGKLLAHPEFLPAVSLSSVSEDEVRLVPVYNRCATKRRCNSKSPHNNHKRKRQVRSRSRRSKAYVDYHSDRDNERLERKRILLSKALRRESQEELLHKSLRSRLKSMLYDNIDQPSSDDDLEELREIALLSRNTDIDKKSTKCSLENDIRNDLNSVIEKDLKNNSDSVIVINETEDSENRDSAHNSDAAEDTELINLRLEALKSAVIKKSRERKKRKVIEHEKKILSQEALAVPDDVAELDEIDKENSFNSKDSSTKSRKCSETEKVLNESNPTINCPMKESTIFPKNDLIENDEENRDKVNLNLVETENPQNPVTDNFKDKSPEKNLLEEDADILRAMLLASMSKKITSNNTNVIPKEETTSVPSQKPASQILPPREIYYTDKQQSLSTAIPRIAVKTVTNKSLGKTDLNSVNKPVRVITTKKIHYSGKSHKWEKISNIEVKPIIIKVNDSDSDDDDDDEFKGQVTNNNLKETVEMFLKKQRAEVEAKITVAANSKQTETVNNGKNGSMDAIKKLNTTKQISKVVTKNEKQNPLISNNILLKKNDNREILDKSINKLLLNRSALKLLPKSQQIEYQKLTQQLLNAKKQIKIKKAMKIQPLLKNDTKIATTNFSKVSKPLALNLKLNYQKYSKQKMVPKQPVITEEKALEAVTNLKKILDDLQMQQNGRLQMKGKYQLLVPLLRKINQASNERRQNEGEIKRLLTELQEARTKLANSHQYFISLVQQLVVSKESLDKSFIIENKPLKETKVEMCTSTPIKQSNDIKAFNDGTTWNVQTENLNVDMNEDLVLNESQTSFKLNNNPIDPVSDAEHPQNGIGSVNNTKSVENQFNNSNLHITKCLENVNIVDPNNINNIFIEQEDDDKHFTDYVSPLGSYDREKVDPLKPLCPYDLFGVCRDKECPYSHCS